MRKLTMFALAAVLCAACAPRDEQAATERVTVVVTETETAAADPPSIPAPEPTEALSPAEGGVPDIGLERVPLGVEKLDFDVAYTVDEVRCDAEGQIAEASTRYFETPPPEAVPPAGTQFCLAGLTITNRGSVPFENPLLQLNVIDTEDRLFFATDGLNQYARDVLYGPDVPDPTFYGDTLNPEATGYTAFVFALPTDATPAAVRVYTSEEAPGWQVDLP